VGQAMTIEMVFLDIGGVLYDDTVYARAWHRALRDAGARFTDAEFDEEYRRARTEQSGSFRRRLIARFLPEGDLRELETLAARYWHYPPSALYDDAVPCLEKLRGGYRLGVIANQPGEVRSAMRRDGLDPFFEVWGVSDELGVGKPDPALFELSVVAAGVAPGASVMVGDRLDYDMRPAALVGMRTVWMLRGEAPDEPTPDQLAETDGAIRSLSELPAELERLSSR
jgi:HAD superfamily hydrolase (TIGR01549 family)